MPRTARKLAAGPCKGASGLGFERLCAEISPRPVRRAAGDAGRRRPGRPGAVLPGLEHRRAGPAPDRRSAPGRRHRRVPGDGAPAGRLLPRRHPERRAPGRRPGRRAHRERRPAGRRPARAGPDAAIWTPLGPGTPRFWARRFAHETVVHRADATFAAGAPFTVEPALALDALDEWMELGSLPMVFDVHPERRALLGPGRTLHLHLHATDTPPEAEAEWVVDLTGDRLAWRRAHEKSAVAVRGPLTELLLLVYGRRTVDDARVEVLGDRGLLDFWRARVAFA